MKNKLLLYLMLCFPAVVAAQGADERAILDILRQQTISWNKGDVEGFMKGYWNSDSLMYIGKSGITWGYRNTLNNYRKNYGDTVKMGKLFFDILEVKRIAPDCFFVVGKWMLKRSIGDAGGHYSLLFRKKNGAWVIVADHSS